MIGYDPTKPYKHALKHIIRQTWDKCPYVEIADGYYPTFRRKHTGVEIDHTDGIGTKGVHHWQQGTFAEAAQDALAMNVNDLAIAGFKAYKTQAHLMVQDDDERSIVAVMSALGKLCEARGIAITGGETGVHNNLRGMELSLTVTGVQVEQRKNVGLAEHDDVFVLIPSSGPHSNGFTLLGHPVAGTQTADPRCHAHHRRGLEQGQGDHARSQLRPV
jgi:phosphoribosylaminoimidazole (AIR) synthetase